ncbi:MAG: CotH kinase family protein [Candidatus Izemoplasmatales bacterium]|nr:CotH kinase family protein [Candidatus Izemoplasmatales bacterium]
MKNKTMRFILITVLMGSFLLWATGCAPEETAEPKMYTVVVEEGEGYTVQAEGTSVEEGRSFIFSMIALEDYDLSEVTVTADGTALEKDDRGRYVLPNVRKHTIVRVSGVKLRNLVTLTFDTQGGGELDSLTFRLGETPKLPSAKKTGFAFSHWCSDPALQEKIPLGAEIDQNMMLYAAYRGINDIVELDTPILIIHTEDLAPVLSKEDYIAATVTVTNTIDEYEFANNTAGIRGRGNFTWDLEKKGYRIKFDQRTEMFGEEAAKNWTLIPNHTDKSLLRNYLALNFATRLDNIAWSSTARHVELYLNNEYLGLYLLCEQNQVDETRVNIEEGSTDTDTGFFIERDRYAFHEEEMIEGLDYFTTSPSETYIIPGDPAAYCYVLKSPESDDDNYTSAQFEFIRDYIVMVENAIIAGDYNMFISLCDEGSFIDYFMVDQVFTNWEANRLSSFYMFKDKGGKLKLGPLWDFDLAVGFSPGQPRNAFVTENYWFMCLMDMPEFKQHFIQRYLELDAQIEAIFEDIEYTLEAHSLAIHHNFEKWDITEVIYPEDYNSQTPMQYLKTYEAHAEFVEQFLSDRVSFLNTNIENW